MGQLEEVIFWFGNGTIGRDRINWGFEYCCYSSIASDLTEASTRASKPGYSAGHELRSVWVFSIQTSLEANTTQSIIGSPTDGMIDITSIGVGRCHYVGLYVIVQ